MRLGDELVIENFLAAKGGKGGGFTAHMVRNGLPLSITEAMIAEITFADAAELRMSFRGMLLDDSLTLGACGLQTDDELVLEMTSPVCPPVLTLLRKVDPPGTKKGGKKGGKGGGKKKK